MPSVSSDGKVVAYAGSTDCPFAVRQCADFPFTRTIITGVPGKGNVTLSGRGSVNRNGRFVHIYETGWIGAISNGIWDLHTGTQLFEGHYRGSPQSIADDGTAVFASYGFTLFRKGQFE